jgi:hypothetical protein
MSGYVRIENRHGIIAQRRYSGKLERRRIIAQWKREYGPMFNSCFIMVAPGKVYDFV